MKKRFLLVTALCLVLSLVSTSIPVSAASLSDLLNFLSSRRTQDAALRFSEGSVVDGGNGASLNPTAALTIEAWIKTSGGEGNGGIVAKKSATEWTENKGYSISLFGTGSGDYAGRLNAKIGNVETITAARVDDNRWHYVVMAWKSGNLTRAYIDGTETAYLLQGAPAGVAPSADKLRIGQYYDSMSFNGIIDEVRISKSARSAGEIAANWNAGKGKEFTADAATVGLWHFNEGNRANIINYETLVREPGNPVIPTGTWDEHIREIGNVLYEPGTGKTYKIFYSGYQGAYQENNVFIGYAYSNDGLVWTKATAAGPVIDRSLEDPYVVRVDGIYHLYAEDKAAGGREIRKYHSSDCLTWVNDGVVLSWYTEGFETYMVASPIVWKESRGWYMLYEGINGEVSMGLATSPDGKNWTRYANNPVMRARPGKWDSLSVVPDDIEKIGFAYFLTYHGNGGQGFFAGKAISFDLHGWTRFDNPIAQDADTMSFLFDGEYHMLRLVNPDGGIGRYDLGISPDVTKDASVNRNHGAVIRANWVTGVKFGTLVNATSTTSDSGTGGGNNSAVYNQWKSLKDSDIKKLIKDALDKIELRFDRD